MTINRRITDHLKCLEELRKIDPEMPIQRAAIFMYVASHEHCTGRDIAAAMGVDLSTTNRNVRDLGDVNRRGKPGHGLVASRADDVDPRRMVFSLTPLGKRIASTISQNLGD